MNVAILRKVAAVAVAFLVAASMAGCSEEKNRKQSSDTGSFDFEKKTVTLNSGYEMPIIGLGTWTLSDEEAESSVYNALKVGMRLIDTARYYDNEVVVGWGLKRAIDEGIVTREDVFVTSKIYGGDHEKATEIIDDALKDLNVDYIDLNIHFFPHTSNTIIDTTMVW